MKKFAEEMAWRKQERAREQAEKVERLAREAAEKEERLAREEAEIRKNSRGRKPKEQRGEPRKQRG
jgi:hypothetical protein